MGVEPLSEACELAFAVARQGRESVPAIEAPASMRSFLWVAQLPPRAITVAQRVIDSDDGFRQRVASQATEAKVGRAGYLWLTRPPGWDTEFAGYGSQTGVTDMPTSSVPAPTAPAPTAPLPAAPTFVAVAPMPAPAATIPPRPAPPAPPAPPTLATASAPATVSTPMPTRTPVPVPTAGVAKVAIEDELASLRGLVDRLADERHEVAQSAAPGLSLPSSADPNTEALDAVRRDLVAAESERDVAHADCQAAELRITELENQLQSFDHERSLVQVTLSAAEKNTAAARDLRDAAILERDSALEALETLRAERYELVARVESAEQAKADLEVELAELGAQWSIITREMEEIAEQRVQVEAELDRLSRARVVSVHDNAALFNRLADQLGRIEAERNMLAAQLETAHARVSSTRSALNEANLSIEQQFDATEAAFGEMTTTVGTLSSEVEQINETRQDLDALLADAAEVHENPSQLSAAYTPIVESIAQVTVESVVEESVEELAPVMHDVPPMPAAPSVAELGAFDGSSIDDLNPGRAVDLVTPIPPMPAAPVLDEIPPMPAAPVLDTPGFVGFAPPATESPLDSFHAFEPAVGEESILGSEADTFGFDNVDTDLGDTSFGGTTLIQRTQILLSTDAELDPALAAREVVQTIDVVVLVDGDAVAEMGWPTLTLEDRRGAIVEYLEGLAASTGAAAHVIFDRKIGGEDSKPDSKVVRVELTLPQMTPASSLAMRIDDYPVEWPITVVSDDAMVASEAASRGASQLGNGRLLDLFIAQ